MAFPPCRIYWSSEPANSRRWKNRPPMPVRFNADDVIDIACHGRGTVYRTLMELVEAGLLEWSDGMHVKRGFG